MKEYLEKQDKITKKLLWLIAAGIVAEIIKNIWFNYY